MAKNQNFSLTEEAKKKQQANTKIKGTKWIKIER